MHLRANASVKTFLFRNQSTDCLEIKSSFQTDGMFLFAVLCLIFFLITPATADPLDNWGVQQLGTDILTGVTYGSGTYLVVGYNGKVWTSPDASTWIDRTYDTSTKSYCVTFANGVFAAGGIYKSPSPPYTSYYDGVQSSTDGINWTTTGISFYGNGPYGITYINNEFFSVGGGATVMSSSDGYAWGGGGSNYGTSPDIYGVAYGNGMYVVVTKYAYWGRTNNWNLWASSGPPQSGLPGPIGGQDPNFRNSGTTSDLLGVAYGNATFVAIGTAGTIITSPDGITWTSRTSGTTNTLYGISFGDGVFVTAGAGGTILTSPDGITWTSRASGTTNLLRGITFANHRFIAVGVSGTITISGSAATSGIVANISTRSIVEAGDNPMIAGIIIQGGNKTVIVRAIGPSLTAFGVTNALADPTLELHDSSSVIATNNDWQTTEIGGIITSSQVAAIQSSGLAPTSVKESAIIATLAPGSYTAVVRGVNGTTGTGLVEVYALP